MSRKAVGVGVALCLIGATFLTLGAQTSAVPDIPKIDVQKFTLPNGLEVILSENHKLPIVGVDLWYHVGPVNEVAGRTGFAHLFEHMMFQGSKHVPSDTHFKLLQGAGASSINGTTDFDRTNYFETVPSNQLELALWMESDRMGYLLEKLDQSQLSNQQDVVRNERRQSVENRPYGIVEEGVTHLLFAKEHPYYAQVIGSHADIQAARLEDVKQFFKLYYRPNNATVSIAGDIDKAATRKLVEKYFGTLKRGAPIPRVTIQTPPLTSERRGVIQDRIELPRVYMAWLTPPAFKDGDADAEIASIVLGGGRSSRLYKKLVYEKQIAQSVTAFQNSLQLGSMFQIEATASPSHTAVEIEAAIQEELNRFRTEGPSAAEVERARNTSESQIVRGLQRAGGFGGVADQLNYYNHYLGTPDYLAQDIMRHRHVTPDSVRRFAEQWLKDNARVVVHGVPGKQDLGPEVPGAAAENTPGPTGTDSVNADEPWRATQPKAAPAAAARFPVPETFQLPNGLTVILAEQSSLPFVSAQLVVGSGSAVSPVDRPGLANFAVAMLEQGTATRSALQLADDVAQIGATLRVASTMDESTVTTASLARNFPAALNLIADVALHPSFPNEEVERQRTLRLGNLVQQRSNSAVVVNAVLSASLYGQSHPYGFTELGTAESNKKITRDEIQAFWRRHVVPSNAALVVAGAMTLPELRRLVERAFAEWSGARPGATPIGQSTSTTSAKLVIVDRPGAPQTQVRVGIIGAARSSPDYIPLRVMNEVLGGGFSSRINMNLREEHGYTYGANSQFMFRRGPGPFSAGAGVRTDVTVPAVQELLKEIQRMGATSVTPDELVLAKDSITRSLPSTFETSENTVASLSSLFVYGLSLNYYSTLTDRIQGVDAAAVQAAARKYLVPDKLVVVAVGDRSKFGSGLEAQLGPAELRDPDGIVLNR
jgi:zinc protease